MSSYSAFTFVLTIIKTQKMNHISRSYFYYKSKCVVVSDHICVAGRLGRQNRLCRGKTTKTALCLILFIYLFIPSLSIFLFSSPGLVAGFFSQPLHGGTRRTMKLFSGRVGGRRPEREEEGGGICKAAMMKGEQSACYSHC